MVYRECPDLTYLDDSGNSEVGLATSDGDSSGGTVQFWFEGSSFEGILQIMHNLLRHTSNKLLRKCPGDHVHQHVESSVNVGGVSMKCSVIAGRYPVEMCEELAKIVAVAMVRASSARARRMSKQSLQ